MPQYLPGFEPEEELPVILTAAIMAPVGTPFPDFSALDEEVVAVCDLENPDYCEACQ